MSRSNGNTPPHNLEAEESLLGAMLLSRDAALVGLSVVRTADRFYRPAHGSIFEAIGRLTAAGVAADAVTVADELGRTHKLTAIGGAGTLVSLQVNTPSTKSAADYAAIVMRFAELRDVVAASDRAKAEALDGNLDTARAVFDSALAGSDIGPAAAGITPIDVGAVMLDGTPAVKAELLRRTDGEALLVRGGVTLVHGEPAAGKTFVAVEAARQAITAGDVVAVVDYEGSERTWAERLAELNVPAAVVTERLVYLRPGATSPHLVARVVMRWQPALVILDSLAAALTDHGRDEDRTADTLFVLRGMCRPLAIAGAAVVVIDHVTKDRDGRGKWGRGSSAKLGEADTAFSLELVEPFARGHDGSSNLRIAKDRHGVIGPERSIAAEVAFGTNIAGRFRIELRPASTPSSEPWHGPTECMAAVRQVLEQGGNEMSAYALTTAIKTVTGQSFRRATVAEAAERLARSPTEPVAVRVGARARVYRFDAAAAELGLVEEPA